MTTPAPRESWTTPPADGGLWVSLVALAPLAFMLSHLRAVAATPVVTGAWLVAVVCGVMGWFRCRRTRPWVARLCLAGALAALLACALHLHHTRERLEHDDAAAEQRGSGVSPLHPASVN